MATQFSANLQSSLQFCRVLPWIDADQAANAYFKEMPETTKCLDETPRSLHKRLFEDGILQICRASNDTNMSRHAPVMVDSPEHVAPDQVLLAPIPLILSRDFAEFARIVGLAQDEPERLPAKIHRLEEELDAAVNQLQLASMVARDIQIQHKAI